MRTNISKFCRKRKDVFINYERTTHTLEALVVEVDLLKLLLGGAKVGCDSLSDGGKTGVPGGVRSLLT